MKSIKKVIKKVFAILSVVVVLASVQMIGFSASAAELPNGNTAYALTASTGVDEVDEMLDNFTSFISGIVTAVGVIVIVWGVVQVAMSIMNHDPSQKMQGFFTLAAGVLVIFAPQIVAFLQS